MIIEEKIPIVTHMTELQKAREEVLIARFDAIILAEKIRHEELDRRLELLNKLREEVLKDRSEFVLKTVYDIQGTDSFKWREGVTVRLTTLETRSMTWTAAVGIIFLIVNILMIYFGRK